MFSKPEIDALLIETKEKQEALGSWEPIKLQVKDGKFVVFSGLKLKSARTVGGRHADLVAVWVEREEVELAENAIQVQVGAGVIPAKQPHWPHVYVRFVELIYPF